MNPESQPTTSLTGDFALLPDDSFPGYQLVREISRGGQGVVYQAIQDGTRRNVAIKVLHDGPFAAASAKRRFEREIELIAQLRHPNIISIFHSGQTREGRQFYVMDYVSGEPLDRHVLTQKLTLEQTLALFAALCDAVQYAHQRGIIHRDLKPSNILVDAEGRPRILDFGLAKLLAGPADPLLSITDQIVGTLAYMSPEQARGSSGSVDARSDVYALGVLLYRVLTGRFPYDVSGMMSDVLRQIAESPPELPTRNWASDLGVSRRESGSLRPGECPIDREVETIILTAIAKERENRYQTAGELRSDVERYLSGQPIAARRDRLYAARTRVRAWMARHRFGTHAILVLLVTTAAQFLFCTPEPLRRLDRLNELASNRMHRQFMPAWSPEVEVIGFDDDSYDAIPRIAETEGLADVSSDTGVSWRRMHGALLRRLARASPRVVAWDIFFRGAQPKFDPDLVRGIEELRASGARVVLACDGVDQNKRPLLSPPILAAADGWGWIFLGSKGGAVRESVLIVYDPPESVSPSLALATYGFARHKGFSPEVLWSGYVVCGLRFFRLVENAGTAERVWHPAQERLFITNLYTKWGVGAPEGTNVDNRAAGCQWTMLPSASVLEHCTTPYHRVFELDDAALKARFADKVILIGDTRLTKIARPDRSVVVDSQGTREEFNLYTHAATISDLLNGINMLRPLILWERLGLVLVCLTAVFAALRVCRRRAWMSAAGLTLAWVSAYFVIAGVLGIVFSPTASVVAFWLSFLGAGWIEGFVADVRARAVAQSPQRGASASH